VNNLCRIAKNGERHLGALEDDRYIASRGVAVTARKLAGMD
jgi:hypothetical protein